MWRTDMCLHTSWRTDSNWVESATGCYNIISSQRCYKYFSVDWLFAVFPCSSHGIWTGLAPPAHRSQAVASLWTGQGSAQSGNGTRVTGTCPWGSQPGAHHKSCMWCWTHPGSSRLQNCAGDWPRTCQACGHSLWTSEVVLSCFERMCLCVEFMYGIKTTGK
jgi:hypothetical protein